MFADSDASPNPQNPSRSNPSSPPPNPPKFPQIPSNSGGPSAPQELTLSYLCENPKPPLENKPDLEKSKLKGKEIAVDAPPPPDSADRFIERDFLQLAPSKPNAKREAFDSPEIDNRDKKAKVDSLNLSLGLNAHAFSANTSIPPVINGGAAPVPPRKSYSNNNTRVTNSEDFGASMSYSYFSHNPSCSLTNNSLTENFENDQIWVAGEGTNGSVHSRFKPVGDGNKIIFVGGNAELSNNNNNNSVYRAENGSFLPSELPARMVKVNGAASLDSGRNAIPAISEKLLKDVVVEKVPLMAQSLHELPNDVLDGLRECLKKIMESAERKGEFDSLQRKLDRRTDLTFETLSKAHKTQLQIFVAIKTMLVSYVSGKVLVPNAELVEIFMLTRCRNITCKGLLPVDNCDCKICSGKKGFCSACMCPVCFKFDSAANTCSWVGCDVCSHWCHAACGIDKNLIRPGQSLKGPVGTTGMQFLCPGCDHASEMFGFVKDVFNACAKEWSLEALVKELDCVRKIFVASEDFEGKGLHAKVEEVLHMLRRNTISTKDACDIMLQFFKYGVTEFSVTGSSSGNILAQAGMHTDPLTIPSAAAITLPEYAINVKPRPVGVVKQMDAMTADAKALAVGPHFTSSKEDDVQSLETVVRCKEAEAKLFQRLADEARKEAENLRQIALVKSQKLEEYATNLKKLCLQEAEERRRKKLEELKVLENSNGDYHNMKLRMQAEIAGLLERMEATKKMWI